MINWALDRLSAPASLSAKVSSLARATANPHDSSTVSPAMGIGAFAVSVGGFFAPFALLPSAGPAAYALSVGLSLLPSLAAGAGRSAELAASLAPSAARAELSRSGSRLRAFSAAARAVGRSLAATANPALPRAVASAPLRLQAAALRPIAAMAKTLPGPFSGRLETRLKESSQRARLALLSLDGEDDRDWMAARAVKAFELAERERSEAALYAKLAFDRARGRSCAALAQMIQLSANLGADPLSDREFQSRPLFRKAVSPLTPGPARLEDALDMMERLELSPLYRPAPGLPGLLELIETQGQQKPGVWETQSPYIEPRLEALRVKAEALTLAAVVGEARPDAPRSNRPNRI